MILIYNLDVIISVGYRVKSLRGTRFRIWANQVLKEYLIKGQVLNQRIDRLEQKLSEHDRKFDLILKNHIKPSEGVFYDGQIFDAYRFVADLVKSATISIVLIDNYVDESVLHLLSKRKPDVLVTVYTRQISEQLNLDLVKYHSQYPPIVLKKFTKSHDRFLIIDHATVYHLGASIKDLGKKWFAFTRINMDPGEITGKLGREP